METKKTDKTLLVKGIKTLVFALLSLFIGPILMTMALGDKENSLYIPLLIVACLICAAAVFLIFKGIRTIMDSMFKKNN
ncbi:DUF6095 family protein [Mariniflexile sp. HNIBRBA6329]|uniref:DUF6095 family protein n=1 Tax=Mariniflexile sp. HNIBRBA6329 TaxID=3373088 RepID=UPI00374570F3